LIVNVAELESWVLWWFRFYYIICRHFVVVCYYYFRCCEFVTYSSFTFFNNVDHIIVSDVLYQFKLMNIVFL